MFRVQAKDFKTYESTKSGWKRSKKQFPELVLVAKLYKSNKRVKELVDEKDSRFLKGCFDGQPKGERINVLPNGEILEKAFSLFAPHLKIHDQTSHDHWDVIYQNEGGTWAYIYTVEKKKAHRKEKYCKVEKFEKLYNKLVKNVTLSLKNSEDIMVIPIYTLLKTYMRVGNEIYYNAHGHKGLTTLTKADVKITTPRIKFNYVGKDGVPIEIIKTFPFIYLNRLQNSLKRKKNDSFVFDKVGKMIHETDFKRAFQRYCGEEFYPHIVRSHYATMKVKRFLKNRKKSTKEEVNKLYLSIAKSLGHKSFNKKIGKWQENYTVTVHSYIQPELVEKIEKLIK